MLATVKRGHEQMVGLGSIQTNVRGGLMVAKAIRAVACIILLLNVSSVYGQATPPSIGTDPWINAHQVGDCISTYGANSCTASDFRITTLNTTKVIDACLSPNDYMQVDVGITYTKATPQRNDIGVWFYRGEDSPPTVPFSSQDAINGDYCTRIELQAGLTTPDGGQTGLIDGLADGDTCVDSPSGAAGVLSVQGESAIVLPCRDINSDGIVDISACTSWDNNTNTLCYGPEYTQPLANQIQPGTGSKCNCGEFGTQPIQVPLPDLSVTKSCNPTTNLTPGDTTTCTVTITNTGAGVADGATSSGDTGFFWIDNYPSEFSYAGGTLTIDNPDYLNETVSATDNPGAITIYPDDIRAGGGTVTTTYQLQVDKPINSVNNVVCAHYRNSDGADISYENDAGSCDQVTFTPVTLSSFLVDRDPSTGELVFNWSTSTETGNLGFNLYAVVEKRCFPSTM